MSEDPNRSDDRRSPFPGEPTWVSGLAVLRLATQRQVPALVRSRRRPPLRRTAVVATRLAWAVAGWAVGARRRGGSESKAVLSARLRTAAESLGPTYLKLCQIVSSGEGIFPPELVAEMKKCRDQVPPQPWDVVERTVVAELGGPIADTFSSFDRTPLAAASIAQVHAATLLDGTEVVVKVQREGIRPLVTSDLRAMSSIAPHLVGRIPIDALANPPALVELFAETISRGARLPPRGREHDRPGQGVRRVGPARIRHPASAPSPRDPTDPGHGAASRLRLRRRRLHEERRHRHPRGDPDRAAGVHRGMHDPRDLPRRPPRREPAGTSRRQDRPARLRHHAPG